MQRAQGIVVERALLKRLQHRRDVVRLGLGPLQAGRAVERIEDNNVDTTVADVAGVWARRMAMRSRTSSNDVSSRGSVVLSVTALSVAELLTE